MLKKKTLCKQVTSLASQVKIEHHGDIVGAELFTMKTSNTSDDVAHLVVLRLFSDRGDTAGVMAISLYRPLYRRTERMAFAFFTGCRGGGIGHRRTWT